MKTVLVRMDRRCLPQTPEPLKPYNIIEVLPGDHEFVFDYYGVQGGTAYPGGATINGSLQVKRGIWYPDQSRQTARFTVIAGHEYRVRYRFLGPMGCGATALKSMNVTDMGTEEVVFEKDILGKPGYIVTPLRQP